MLGHIHLASDLPVDEFERRYRGAHEPHERSWWQILWLIARRYNKQGAVGKRNRQHTHSHRPALTLSQEQAEELPTAVR